MIQNLLVWLALAALVMFIGWLLTRAWRTQRRFLRRPGLILASLFTC